MKTKLLELSKEINADILQALRNVSETADRNNIDVFVVGAAARDMILQAVYGFEPKRATIDIDIGIRVEDWTKLIELKNALIATRMFAEYREPQRLLFKEKLPVDIIPFGKISEPEGKIIWPPGKEVTMSTIGFREAYQHAVTVRFKTGFEMKVASLCGLAIMKIISWDENYPERTKDAMDLGIIMRKYLEAGNEERIYAEDSDLFETGDDFDYEHASSRLLGRDVAAISEPKTKEAIIRILQKQTGKQDRYKLVEDMMKPDRMLKDNFEETLALLEEFKKGFMERT